MNEALKRKIEKGPDDTWTFRQQIIFGLEELQKKCGPKNSNAKSVEALIFGLRTAEEREQRDRKKFNVEPVNLAKIFPEEVE